jgi:ubiquinone/menaquinone biosynthesis C-methylase UbiE
MSERTFDDFDKFANDYRSLHSANIKLSGADSFYFAENKVEQLKKLETDAPLRMLDFGCGDGVTALYVNKHFPLWKATGIDISVQSILMAKEKNIPNAVFQTFNGTAIPFADEYFDLVFIAAVFHHIDFSLHPLILKELHRVLIPGGRLYIFEHNSLNPATRYLVKICAFDKDARLLKYCYTKSILKQAGFSDLKLKFILFFPRWKIFKLFIRLEKFLGWVPFGGQYFYRAVKKNYPG